MGDQLLQTHSVVFILLLCAFSAGAKEKILPPNVTDASIELGPPSLDDVDMKLKLEVENPNNQEVRVEQLKAQVTVKGIAPVDVKSDEVVTLKAHSKSKYTLPLKLPWKSALAISAKVIEKKSIPYHVKGTAKIAGKEIPFDHEGSLPTK